MQCPFGPGWDRQQARFFARQQKSFDRLRLKIVRDNLFCQPADMSDRFVQPFRFLFDRRMLHGELHKCPGARCSKEPGGSRGKSGLSLFNDIASQTNIGFFTYGRVLAEHQGENQFRAIDLDDNPSHHAKQRFCFLLSTVHPLDPGERRQPGGVE